MNIVLPHFRNYPLRSMNAWISRIFWPQSNPLSFADGHALIHKWQTTTLLNAKGNNPQVQGGALNVDWIWFSQHAAADPDSTYY
jgi:hypothetical protein